MAGHKLNHVIAAEDVIDPRIEASGLFGAGPVRLSFNLRGQKKRVNCNLESADNVTDAIRTLAPVLPNLRANVRYDEQKNKYRKVK